MDSSNPDLGRIRIDIMLIAVIPILLVSGPTVRGLSQSQVDADTLTLVSVTTPPAGFCAVWCPDVTYHSNLQSPLLVQVFLVMHNSIGQTIDVGHEIILIPPNANATVHFVEVGLQPGNYAAAIFATTTGGISVSTTLTTWLTL